MMFDGNDGMDWFKAWFAFVLLVNFSILGFLGWVIVKLLQHFGVI